MKSKQFANKTGNRLGICPQLFLLNSPYDNEEGGEKEGKEEVGGVRCFEGD